MAAKSPKRKVGLALGSGSGRGLAHIGVLEVLEKENIPVDMICGTSIGAMVGASFASGKTAGEIKETVLSLDWWKRAQLLDLALPKTGFLSGRKIKSFLEETIGDLDFADLKMPFACVAADIMSGEEVVLSEGPVTEAVMASISIPVLFKVVKRQGRYLVDGGIVNPVPVSVLKSMGADFIIAVNVLFQPINRVHNVSMEELTQKEPEETKEPNIFNIMMHLVNIASHRLVENSLEGSDVVIEPEVSGIGFSDFRHASETIRQGKLAARHSIQDIKKRLSG